MDIEDCLRAVIGCPSRSLISASAGRSELNLMVRLRIVFEPLTAMNSDS